MCLHSLSKVPCPGGGWVTPNPAPRAPSSSSAGVQRAPRTFGGAEAPLLDALQGPVPLPAAAGLLGGRCLCPFWIFSWCDLGKGRQRRRRGGAGTVWGQKQGEGMQPVNPGQRQSLSQRGCLPLHHNFPLARQQPPPYRCLAGVGGPAAPHPAPLALRLPPAAPRHCT